MSWRRTPIDLLDVNVLIYAYWSGSADHGRFRDWLERLAREETFALSEIVLSAFVRIVTNPRILTPPAPLQEALRFVEELRVRPNAVLVSPGSRHWSIFKRLCIQAGAKGNLVADAYLAALAIEHGCEWVTTDRDYTRFEGLRSRHPLT